MQELSGVSSILRNAEKWRATSLGGLCSLPAFQEG